MLTQDEALKIFSEASAILTGHFLLSSGLHSENYLQCARVLQYPLIADRLCAALSEAFGAENLIPQVVLAPALGGILVAYGVAQALVRAGYDRSIRHLFVEREDRVLRLRRGFEIRPGERVLVVEDVITTGGSTLETMEVARAAGGRVIGIGALVDRSAGAVLFDVPYRALLRLDIRNYAPADCPLCRLGTPAVKPGSRE